MEELLTPVSRTYRKQAEDAELLTLSKPPEPASVSRQAFQGSSPTEALQVLKDQPDYDTLLSVLMYLVKGSKVDGSFNILTPSPQAAQIIHILISEIVPNYWTVLKEASLSQKKSRDIDLLLNCLSSISGINATLSYLRVLIQEAKVESRDLKESHVIFNLGFTLELLSDLLKTHDKAKRIWEACCSLGQDPARTRTLRREFVLLLAGGKILSLAAEAETILQQAEKLKNPLWLADGKQYVDWLGRNLVSWLSQGRSDEDVHLCADILSRALQLGYQGVLIKILFEDLFLPEGSHAMSTKMMDDLSHTDQRKLLTHVLSLLSTQYLDSTDADSTTEDYPMIWAAAGAISAIIGTSGTRKEILVDWLTSGTGAGIGESCAIRRAAVATLVSDVEALSTVLERSISQFGDELHIRHSPMLNQEARAQVLLLSAGYVHRTSPIKLTLLMRQGTYLNAISNHLGSSNARAKSLGMVVGEALSSLVHSTDKRLDFHMDETNTEDARWYKSLVHVSDKVGPISPLKSQSSSEVKAKMLPQPKATAASKTRLRSAPVPKPGFVIEEVSDEEGEDEDEEEDLPAYAKPDSDAEDSDDDPTLINRNKPKAPVYIRDLITYFRDSEDYDRQKLALNTAPTLIRRKANFGTEVSSHAAELATLLVGLQDKYDLEEFHDLRIQGMIAIIVAQPKAMGPWFAKTFFDGDYSLSQRGSILVVIGLSARELAGFDASEYASASVFPSKQLPAKMEKYYALPSSSNTLPPSSRLKALPPNALDTISHSLSQTFLEPLAAEAADKATGPDALKLSSFTARLKEKQVSRSKTSKSRQTGIRSIPNTTASLIATSFFFPLTSRFSAALHSSSSSTRGIVFQPYLLALYIKTLSLLLHAAGPSTLSLPQMTSEFWDLLLGIRPHCTGELDVTHAVLFGLMTILEVNENDERGLCERQGREVVESVEWVSGVFDNTRGGDGGGEGGLGEENQVKMMAAGMLIKLKEMVEKYQAFLMGDLIGFS